MKHDFARGNIAEISRRPLVDFVTYCQESDRRILRWRAEINRLYPNFIKMPATKPPVP